MSKTIGHGAIDAYLDFADDWQHLEEARMSEAITEEHAAMTLYRMCDYYAKLNKHAYEKYEEYNRDLKERLKDDLKAQIAERD